MPSRSPSIHGQWGSRWAFILAATGSAVGLGNIWRFPYVVGEYGGAAFVLVYLLCIALLGIPVMMSEILIGRRGRQSPINTMRTLPAEFGASRWWQGLGWLGVLAGFMVLSFYSVVAGWSLSYVPAAAAGTFVDASAETVSGIFDELLANTGQLLLWHTLFMGMVVWVVSRGVRSGIEAAVRILMPILFLLLLVMVGYGMGAGAFAEALEFLFTPDFGAIGPEAILVALGQAFFTLSLGLGAIMAYGSYLSSRSSIPANTAWIAGADTLIAIIAGLAIFPIVFAAGMDPESGPGLVFVSLSYGFGQMPLGVLFGTIFFVLLSFAAWTSAISIAEPATAYLVETRGWRRARASAVVGLAAWVFGIGSLLSLNHWAEVQAFGMTFMDIVEYLSTSVMLPLGGLLMALFAGWVMPRHATISELGFASAGWYETWRFLVRYVVPAAITLVFLHALGVFALLGLA